MVLWSFLLVGQASLKDTKLWWFGVCLIASWGIWIERNARTFERNERSIHNLKLKFFHSIQVAKCFGCFYFLFFARFTRFLYFPFKLAFVFFCFFFFLLASCVLYFHCIVIFSLSMKLITYKKKKIVGLGFRVLELRGMVQNWFNFDKMRKTIKNTVSISKNVVRKLWTTIMFRN